MNEKIANQLSRIYYYTLGRFIDAACLYKLDLKEYQIKPCTINRDQYEFIVTDQYLAGLEDKPIMKLSIKLSRQKKNLKVVIIFV